MNVFLPGRLAVIFAPAALMVMLSGCVVSSGEYYDEGAAYYEPYGVTYGYWGADYEVGPLREGEHHHGEEHHEVREERHVERAYRQAPSSRPAPSIPSRSRFGGRRSR